jgi:hypothetical protein
MATSECFEDSGDTCGWRRQSITERLCTDEEYQKAKSTRPTKDDYTVFNIMAGHMKCSRPHCLNNCDNANQLLFQKLPLQIDEGRGVLNGFF